MPRAVSENLAAQIVALIQDGRSQAHCSRFFHVSRSVVQRVWERFQETGEYRRRRGQGRRRITTARTDRAIVRTVRRDPFTNAVRIAQQQRDRTGQNQISAQTVRNRLHESGLRSRAPNVVPVLTLRHRQARLQFAREHVDWTDRQWSNVLFSDESRFCLQSDDHRIRAWRRRGERYSQRFVRQRRTHNGPGVMVWAGISWNFRTELHFVRGTVNQFTYIDNILRPHVLPMRRRIGRNFVFMQDNATSHTARRVRQFFQAENITVLNHPANSPDLNPIEHIWDNLGRRLRRYDIQNLRQLENLLRREWDAIPQEEIRACISMRNRLNEVIQQRGGNTSY